MPNGVRFVTYADKREEVSQVRTDAELHSQPGPERIPVLINSNDRGMATDDANDFGPYGDHNGVHYSSPDTPATLGAGHTVLTKQIYRLPNNVGSHRSSDNQQISSPPIGVVP